MPNMGGKTGIWCCVFCVIAVLVPADAATDDASFPAVYKSIRHEFGSIRGGYFIPDRRVSEQIMMGLRIPYPTMHLADGNYLISGCRPHSCDEKASVIVTAAGVALMAGLIHFQCNQDPNKPNPAPAGAVSCDLVPRFTILAKQRNNHPVLAQELRDWAAREGYDGATETRIVPH
jgi:hypothetical protein